MKTADLDSALAIARSDAPLNVADLEIFDGFGLAGFAPITCTLDALAMLVRWQCVCFDGSIDAVALQEIATCGRHRFSVLTADIVPPAISADLVNDPALADILAAPIGGAL